MRGRYEIEQEANEAMNRIIDREIAPDLPRLLTLLLEVELDIREMYARGVRAIGIEA